MADGHELRPPAGSRGRPELKVGLVPAHGPGSVPDLLHQASLAQRYGFDSLWVEEHHEAGDYWPTPFLPLAALAAFVPGLTLGTNILVLPLHDPVHVAEHAAALDVMTGGHFILGVAIGDDAREFALFRVTASRRGGLFEEQIQIIRALWQGQQGAFHGEFYNLENPQLSVTPVQAGGPPIWVGGWGPRQLRRAAALGDAWFPGPVADLDSVVARQREYEAEVRSLAKDPDGRVRPLTRDVIVASTSERAWQIAREQVFPSYYRSYVQSDHPLVGGETTRFSSLDEVARNRMVVGDPDEITGQLLDCVRSTRCDHLILRLKLPGVTPPMIGDMIHLLGQQVLTSLRGSL